MKKILLIEDNEIIRCNISEFLELENFEVTCAEDGLAGVELAKSLIPDLILCDVIMPKLDGYAVLSALRYDPVTATIPFIFLSSKVYGNDVQHAKKCGADDYISKPFSFSRLLDAISAVLGVAC